MIMHPYRPELEHQDLSTITDISGKNPFLEMLTVVRGTGAGFVPYIWQFNDDARHIGKKLSYVKLFHPWNWIIGTGIYLDDVTLEIKKISRRLTFISLAILLVVSALSAFIIQQQFFAIKKRQAAEAEVGLYRKNLARLVAARTQELQEAHSKIKILKGFLPICANCKKIRDDKGYWNQLETYIHNHSEAEFTHGICPTCIKKLYPELQSAKLTSTAPPTNPERNT